MDGNLLEQLASLSVASLSSVSLVGIITRPFKKRIENKIAEWDEMARVVHYELTPNSGLSVKDRITKIDNRLVKVEEVLNVTKRD